MMIRRKKIKNHAQMITLMGVILAVSVFMISSLGAEIANIDFVVSSGSSISIFTEFINVKNTFDLSLNYNLADVNIDAEDNSSLYGNIENIYSAFNQTVDDYFNISFKHDLLFDAKLNHIWYSHHDIIQGYTTVFYTVEVAIYVDDGNSNITEDVRYSIACTPIT
jgi:hypothetical protein